MAIIQDIELKNKKVKMFYRFILVALTLGVCLQFFPIIWMALGTFKTSKELINPIPSIFPEHWSLAGYIEAFSRYRIWDNLYNTFFFCVTIIAVQTVTNTMAAYALSKIKPKGSNAIYILMLGTQMISTTAVLFPTYLMITKMGLIGNKWSRVLISSTWAYAIVLYKNFFDSVPSDLIEAAEIDGAGEFRKIINIIMPLSKPVYAVCILNTFMGVYNDFLFPLMLLPNEKDWTLMIRIYAMTKNTSYAIPVNVIYVFLFVTCLPTIIIYLLAQKHLQQGIATSGLKG